jgi:hypothetical protein
MKIDSCTNGRQEGISGLVTPLAEANGKALDPKLITGFIDAEGCFSIKIVKSPGSPRGWKVHQACFTIHMHSRDLVLLQHLHSFFGAEVNNNSHVHSSCELTAISFGNRRRLYSTKPSRERLSKEEKAAIIFTDSIKELIAGMQLGDSTIIMVSGAPSQARQKWQ